MSLSYINSTICSDWGFKICLLIISEKKKYRRFTFELKTTTSSTIDTHNDSVYSYAASCDNNLSLKMPSKRGPKKAGKRAKPKQESSSRRVQAPAHDANADADADADADAMEEVGGEGEEEGEDDEDEGDSLSTLVTHPSTHHLLYSS